MPAQAKTTSSKKKKTGTSASRTKAAMSAKKQMWAVVLFALGLLICALTLIEGARFWHALHNLLFGLFGRSAYCLGPFLVYIAVIAAMDKPLSSIKAKLWQVMILIVILSGAMQIFGSGLPEDENFIETLFLLYEEGVGVSGGGVAGAVFALPLIGLFDKTGASIIIVLLAFVFVMLITGSTLIGLIRALKKPVEDLESAYAAHVEDKLLQPQKPAKGKARFNIDVDISGDHPAEPEMPEHPVTAPKTDAKDRLPDLAGRADSPVEHISVTEFAPPPESAPQPVPPPERFHPLDDDIARAETGIDEVVERFVGANRPPWDVPVSAGVLELEPQPPGPAVPPKREPVEYSFPPANLLNKGRAPAAGNITEELKNNAQTLVDTLKSFGVQTRITNICRGPSVTRYELQPSAGVKISRITNLADDIALNLASAGIRIEAPIPNKAAVGIEVPNKTISTVHIRELIESSEFRSVRGVLSIALGKDIAGNITLADIGRMPHVLIAGSTGSGKSVCINSIIMSLLYKYSPDEVKLLMVDPKVVELGVYNGIPHLLVPVVTDPKKAAGALGWAVSEMMDRYKTFAANGVKDLAGYNRLAEHRDELQKMPKIVIIIDELADLMMAAPNEVEDSICRLAQMARAAGMHLVIATQRPSVDVITGVIKANIPSRIAFAVSSQVDSRTILDMGGAEKLLGRGDMLFYPVGISKPLRVQGCFVTESEVEAVVEYIKRSDTAAYDEQIAEQIDRHVPAGKNGSKDSGGGFDDEDEMLPQAIECVVEMGQASTSLLQRRLKLGYARAARIVDQLEQKGIVGPFEGSKPRQVLISKERWIEMKLQGAESSQLADSQQLLGQPEPAVQVNFGDE